jgi:hypothetical protein
LSFELNPAFELNGAWAYDARGFAHARAIGDEWLSASDSADQAREQSED